MTACVCTRWESIQKLFLKMQLERWLWLEKHEMNYPFLKLL